MSYSLFLLALFVTVIVQYPLFGVCLTLFYGAINSILKSLDTEYHTDMRYKILKCDTLSPIEKELDISILKCFIDLGDSTLVVCLIPDHRPSYLQGDVYNKLNRITNLLEESDFILPKIKDILVYDDQWYYRESGDGIHITEWGKEVKETHYVDVIKLY